MSLEDYKRSRTEVSSSLLSYKRANTWFGYIESYKRSRTEVKTELTSYKRAKTNSWPYAFYVVFVAPD